MDLGIAGKKALVCAASKGLGRGCALALARNGVAVMITAIMLIKAVIDDMRGRGFGRIVNITSSSVKAPIPQLGLSNGARSGLTGFVAGLARQTADRNVTINNILPGRFDTDRLRAGMAFAAQKSGRSKDEIEAESIASIPARRFGNPEEFGELCAF